MFFDDEKDMNNASNNSMGWDDVLSGNDDNFLENTSVDDSDVLGKIHSLKDDEFDELNLDADDVDDIDDVDDSEFEEILKNDAPKQRAFDAFGTSREHIPSSEPMETVYDVEEQFAGVIDGDNVVRKVNSEPGPILKEKTPMRKNMEVVKKQFKVNPALLVLFLLVAGAAYYFFSDYTNNINAAGNLISNFSKNAEVQSNVQPVTRISEDIPVVNEEETKAPEANVLLGVDKKEKVDVQQSGRINPFLPDKKYISQSINYSASGLPAPPSAYGEENEVTDKMLTIAVSGIMYDDTKPSAIITFDGNDYFVQKGDMLDDYKVIDISKTYVAISYGKNVYKAKVGEEFKITASFPGSAQYKTNGGRQYYSVNHDANQGSGYVSDGDVTIRSR